MPSFATPTPITAELDLVLGEARITAGDRTETVVDVRPTDPGNEKDVKAAELTRVDFSGGKLVVRAPKSRSWFGKPGSIDVTVDLPSGSALDAETSLGDIIADGRLGETTVKIALGKIQLDETGPLRVSSSSGRVLVGRVGGRADISGAGEVRIGSVDGPAQIRNSNGVTVVGHGGGELRLRAANGDILVDRAEGGVSAKTANGSVRLASVVRGAITAESSVGELEIGIREGSAAWLELNTVAGRVRNELPDTAAPSGSDETVTVRAHIAAGDIVIRRAWA